MTPLAQVEERSALVNAYRTATQGIADYRYL